MFADLDRDKFIELLNKLGDDDNEEVVTAARDLHARLTVSGMSWDDLLVPDQADEPEPEEEEETEEPEDGDDASPEGPTSVEELFADVDETALNAEEKKEAESLIDQLIAKGVSEDTKEELDGYREDLKEDELVAMDLKYLRALQKRLGN
jgi:hypothetical protein